MFYTFQNKILNSINYWFKNERSRTKAGVKETKTNSEEKQRKGVTTKSEGSSSHCEFSEREDEMEADYIFEDGQDNEECDDSYSQGSKMEDLVNDLDDVGSTVDLTNEL